MNKKHFLIGARLAFGLLALLAIGTQVGILINYTLFDPTNFLSYFTNLSNILAAVILIVSTHYLVGNRKPSLVDDVIRGAAVLYMTVTGIVYITLLSGEDLGLLEPWVNAVLHYVMPAVVLLDWLYQPSFNRLSLKHIVPWLLFPAGFLVYSLIRGPIVDWYPYPFLDPDKVGGYGGVALYCLAILAAFLLLGWVIMALGNKLKRHVA